MTQTLVAASRVPSELESRKGRKEIRRRQEEERREEGEAEKQSQGLQRRPIEFKQNQATTKLGLESGWKQDGQREFLGPDLPPKSSLQIFLNIKISESLEYPNRAKN